MGAIAGYVTTVEAARVLNLHIITVRRAVASGVLASVKVGNLRLVSLGALKDYQRARQGMSKFDPRRGQLEVRA